jgi:hypothetical protein
MDNLRSVGTLTTEAKLEAVLLEFEFGEIRAFH